MCLRVLFRPAASRCWLSLDARPTRMALHYQVSSSYLPPSANIRYQLLKPFLVDLTLPHNEHVPAHFSKLCLPGGITLTRPLQLGLPIRLVAEGHSRVRAILASLNRVPNRCPKDRTFASFSSFSYQAGTWRVGVDSRSESRDPRTDRRSEGRLPAIGFLFPVLISEWVIDTVTGGHLGQSTGRA